MDKYFAYNSKLPSLVLLLLMVIAAVVLVVNQGFHFAFYAPTYIVSVQAEDTQELFNSISFGDSVARIDREQHQILLQRIAEDQLVTFVQQIQEFEGVESATWSLQTELLPSSIQSRLSIGITAVLMLSLGYLYYSALRKLAPKGAKRAYALLALYALSVYAALFVLMGLLSLVSRFYLLTPASFVAAGIAFIIGLVITFMGVRVQVDLHTNTLPTVKEMLFNNQSIFADWYSMSKYLWPILLLGMVLGLGVQFLADALLIGAGLALVYVSLYYLPEFFRQAFTFGAASPAKKKR